MSHLLPDHTKADINLATTVTSAIVSNVGVNEVMQIIASVVAICSGLMAIGYYFMGIVDRFRKR